MRSQFPGQGRGREKKGGNAPRRRVTIRFASAMVLTICARATAFAGTACELPSAFPLVVEERPLLDTGSPGLVVVRSSAASSTLQPGDVIRQANGRRTVQCSDLERSAGEALAKGLMLLLAVEHEGRVTALALPEPTTEVASTVAKAAPAAAAPAKQTTTTSSAAPAEHQLPSAPAPAAVAMPTATPVVRQEAALPARANAPAELTSKAIAAAAVLATVDEAARFAVPLGAYERRLDDAKNAIAALRIEGEGSGPVRDVIAEAFEYHETARDIRRYKAAELEQTHVDQRGAGAASLPYFSDSDVPRWVERYPFLSESVQQAPRTTHMLLPGEMAGRWNPDQAVELLWDRAAKTVSRLGGWAAGK
jgi:hypothetical protein